MELLGVSLADQRTQLNLKSNERNMSKNNQTTSKKARIKPENQQTKKKGLQARKRAEISAGFAQIALVLLAVILSSFFGFRLSEKKWKQKQNLIF